MIRKSVIVSNQILIISPHTGIEDKRREKAQPLQGAIQEFRGFEATLFVDLGKVRVNQFDLNLYLLLHFLSSISSNKVASKPNNFLIASSKLAMHLPASLSTSAFGGLYRLKANETTAAISKIISVMSCRASHTNSRKVLGGFGGIMLDPNTSRRPSKSALSPRRPVIGQICQCFWYYDYPSGLVPKALSRILLALICD